MRGQAASNDISQSTGLAQRCVSSPPLLRVGGLALGNLTLCALFRFSSAAETAGAACRAHGWLLMERFMYRCHPQMAQLVELIRGGAIGAVRPFIEDVMAGRLRAN